MARAGASVIEGVKLTDLFVHVDDRGSVMHFMADGRDPFDEFGEVYFSACKPNVVKAWHLHKEMTLNYVCVVGIVRVVLVDGRATSPTFKEVQTVDLVGLPFASGSADSMYRLLTIPPGVWNGYRVLGKPMHPDCPTVIGNCADMPHDPDEIKRMHPEEFDLVEYDWGDYDVAG